MPSGPVVQSAASLGLPAVSKKLDSSHQGVASVVCLCVDASLVCSVRGSKPFGVARPMLEQDVSAGWAWLLLSGVSLQ